MSDLIKYEATSGLTFKQQVKFAQQHALVKDADEDLLHSLVNLHLGRCIQLTGFKFDQDEDYDFLLSEMEKEISSHAKGLRISEIPIAFDRGIKKVYGEWVGLSVVTFTGFIHSYMKDPERLRILKELEPEKKELPPQPYDGTNRFEELKKQFSDKGWAEDTGNIIYDWLLETGKIELGYGNQFYNEAKERLTRENKTKLITELNSVVRQSVTNVLRTIESNSSNLTVVLAKKIAINHFIKNNQL